MLFDENNVWNLWPTEHAREMFVAMKLDEFNFDKYFMWFSTRTLVTIQMHRI